jgi:hypothetical protein
MRRLLKQGGVWFRQYDSRAQRCRASALSCVIKPVQTAVAASCADSPAELIAAIDRLTRLITVDTDGAI